MNIIEQLPENQNWVYNNTPIMLVLHHAEASNCTIQDINEWHLANGWSGGCGYHFLVRKDGSVYRGRPEIAIGAHCPGANSKSLGICAEGNYTSETMPIVQLNAIVELCIYLKEKYDIKQIYRHKDLYSTECPGNNYPFDEIKDKIFNVEVKDMDKIVTYLGDSDVFSAIIVAQKNQCALMKKADFDASGLKVDQEIKIGGVYADRYETFKNAGGLV